MISLFHNAVLIKWQSTYMYASGNLFVWLILDYKWHGSWNWPSSFEFMFLNTTYFAKKAFKERIADLWCILWWLLYLCEINEINSACFAAKTEDSCNSSNTSDPGFYLPFERVKSLFKQISQNNCDTVHWQYSTL